jgi:hypothetical protein
MPKELGMVNGDVVDIQPFAGMLLACTHCETETDAYRKSSDPKSVCRCGECGRKHSTDALEVA